MDYDKLESAICNAVKASREYENTEDGGTCNFDTPIIKIPRANRKKLAQMDYRIEPIGRGWSGWYFILASLSGQGQRRTKMAETIAESLKNDGYETMVYYQMD